MKYAFQWLLAAAFLLCVGNTSVMADGEKGKTVPIPLVTGKSLSGDDMRGIIAVPFTAYYQGGTIYISTYAEFSEITIAVENETTGQMWSTATDISDGMGEISIPNGGSGSYTVEIVTEYGECFVGRFYLL